MAASGALQALLNRYAQWTPGSGVKQLPAWQPDNLDDPSAAMFGFGTPHVWWQPSSAPTMSTTLPVRGGGAESSGISSGGLGPLSGGSGGIPGGGGLGNGMGLGNGFGGSGSAAGSMGYGGSSGNYSGSSSYLDGLAAANGIGSTSNSSSWTPTGSTIGSLLGGIIAGPVGAIGGAIAGSLLGPSRIDQGLNSAQSQGAMGISLGSHDPMAGDTFTPDGSAPAAGHPVDSTGFVDGGGQNGSYTDHAPAAGGESGSGWSDGGTHDFGGGQYGGVYDMSGGMSTDYSGGRRNYDAPVASAAHGGSVASLAGDFGRFMSGPMQSDPRTAEFAADLKTAMSELAVALKGDPQAAKVRRFFQASYVEPVEEAIRKKDAEGAMKLCAAMMNEAKRIAQGEQA